VQLIGGPGRHNCETATDLLAPIARDGAMRNDALCGAVKRLDPPAQKEIGAGCGSLIRKPPIEQRPVHHRRLILI